MQQQQQLATVNVGPPPAYEPVPQAPAPWLVTTPRPPTTVSHYRHRQSIYLGVTLIVVGLLSIGFNVVDVCISKHISEAHDEITHYSYNYYYYYGNANFNYKSLGFVGHGFWSGIMSVVAGAFAVGAGRKRSLSLIRTSLVLCLVAASFLLAQFAVSLAGAIQVGVAYLDDGKEFCCTGSCSYHDYYNYYYYYDYDDTQSSSRAFCRETKALIAMDTMLALVSVIGGMAAVWLSVFGCRAACCCTCCCCKEANPDQHVSAYQRMVENDIPIELMSVHHHHQQQQQQGGAPNMIPVSYPIQYPVGASVPAGYQFTTTPMYYPPPAASVLATQPTQPDDVKSPL